MRKKRITKVLPVVMMRPKNLGIKPQLGSAAGNGVHLNYDARAVTIQTDAGSSTASPLGGHVGIRNPGN